MNTLHNLVFGAALAAVAVAGGLFSTTSAHALELACAQPTVYIGDARPGPNPVIGVLVDHDASGWSVVYKLADGQLINRAAQYAMRDTSDASRTTWAGRRNVRPWQIMIGEIIHINGGLGYHERLIDERKGEAVTMDTATSDCATPRPSPPVIARAPVSPTVLVAPSADAGRLDEIERKLNDLANRPAPAPAPAPVIVNAPAAAPAAPVIINNAPAAPAPAAPPIIINTPPQAAVPPPPPAPVAAPPAPPPADEIILIPGVDGHGASVTITVGDTPVQMLLDTGASEMAISDSTAASLVKSGDAKWDGTGKYRMADGSQVERQRIVIHRVAVGSHVLLDVRAGTVPDGEEMMLLDFNTLSHIGRFTIDMAKGKLTFG